MRHPDGLRATPLALICNPGPGGGVDTEGTADRLRALGAEVVELVHALDEVRGQGVERVVVVSAAG